LAGNPGNRFSDEMPRKEKTIQQPFFAEGPPKKGPAYDDGQDPGNHDQVLEESFERKRVIEKKGQQKTSQELKSERQDSKDHRVEERSMKDRIPQELYIVGKAYPFGGSLYIGDKTNALQTQDEVVNKRIDA
jgi:hypothetical protein